MKTQPMHPNNTYNGYSNYETWNVVLWIFNDERYYDRMRIAMDTYARCGCTKGDVQFAISGVFRDKDNLSSTPDGVWLDDKKINWGEVKRAVLDDFR